MDKAIYVVIRKDLSKVLKWPIGAIINQACHAVTSVVNEFYEDKDMKEYLNNLSTMRKVTLQTEDEESLNKICNLLNENDKLYIKWIENPEEIFTCIATKPYSKQEIGDLLKECKLYR
jgi:peptidyl-tRNA hydrolase